LNQRALRSSVAGFFLAAVFACPPEDAILVFRAPPLLRK